MKQTGLDLEKHFKKCCAKYNKLFIPDNPRQEDVSRALLEYYDHDFLAAAISLYVKSNPGPFIIFDFAMQSRTYVDKVKFNRESLTKFKDIVEQTKKRMESE
jgi:hypothetical protein